MKKAAGMFKRIQILKQYLCECSCKHTNSNSNEQHIHTVHINVQFTTAAQLKLLECSREIKTNFDKVDVCVNTTTYKHNEHIHTVIVPRLVVSWLKEGEKYITPFLCIRRFFYKKHESQIFTWVHGYLVIY